MSDIKNALLKAKINNVLYTIWAQTGAGQIIVDEASGETLLDRLATISADLGSAVAGGVTATEVDNKIATAISNLAGGTLEANKDTLVEIIGLISTNEDAITTINNAILNKVDKVSGKELSSNDFTDTLLTKLNGITAGATKVEASSTNGNIKINGTEKTVYKHPTGAGNLHLPIGGTVGQVLRAKGSGQGEWGVAVRSGTTIPSDLLEGELFIQLDNE